MITGEVKNQINQIWNAFWAGGIANPMEVIEQMTYLLFIKRLDELHIRHGRRRQIASGGISRMQYSLWEKIQNPEQNVLTRSYAGPGSRISMPIPCMR